MTPVPSIAFVTPIAPSTPGNGLAHRARAWQRAAARVGRVRTVLVPTHGPAVTGDHELVPLVAPSTGGTALPPRASHAPEWHGRRWAAGGPAHDAIVVLGADLAPFALGAAAALPGCRVVVDLDDDLVAFHRSRGDDDAADRYEAIVDDVRRRADAVTSVTGFDDTVAIANAVAARPADRSPCEEEPVVLMVGNHGYPPNAEGARWFVDEVWPAVIEQVAGARLVLVGPGSEGLPHGVGFVADLTGLYGSASVAVVPLLHGSGSRIKALEAFAHGVAVVGTTIGLDGLDVEHERHCLLADEAPELAAAVVRVLRDDGLATRLADAAHHLVVERYDAAVIEGRAAALVEQVLGSPRRVVVRRAPRLVTDPVADGLLVRDAAAGAVHRLDPATAAVFLVAGTGRSVEDIVDGVATGRDATSADLRATVDAVIQRLCSQGLLVTIQAR
ncbi:glycosyltransferase family 4 protein [Iamia majanohamensis]|uniref:Glycosyltransferase family 4 protein n=1 Tax=Iamia majanohamensis TaxID=467976 RepID=A0AAF0BR40_9ACTN|nr:glycosyltransferase family 4 protein [Iamia majanohamensis]WCO65976.1 glycosyltransferase family 4 protein [Iamia majanohamensis]